MLTYPKTTNSSTSWTLENSQTTAVACAQSTFTARLSFWLYAAPSRLHSRAIAT